jgi:hypothetical protein
LGQQTISVSTASLHFRVSHLAHRWGRCLLTFSTCAVLLMSCQPGLRVAPGKLHSAKALVAVQSALKPAVLAIGPMSEAPAATSVACPLGGSAVRSAGKIASLALPMRIAFSIRYTDCAIEAEGGTAVLTGTVDFEQVLQVESKAANWTLNTQGRVALSGAYDDFIEVDVQQQLNKLSPDDVTIPMRLDGRISTQNGVNAFFETLTLPLSGAIESLYVPN